MRSYFLDEISAKDIKKAKDFLEKNAETSRIDGLYWVCVPEERLTSVQAEHKGCQPHAFAVEVGRNWLKAEFFIRSLTGLRCECSGYCTKEQQKLVIDFMDDLIEQLGIST